MAAPRVPRAVFWALVALATWCAGRELSILTGIGGAEHGPIFAKPVLWTVAISASLLCMARAARGTERVPWLLIGSGSLLWALGDVYWGVVLADREVIPVPSLADAGYLLFPPLVFAGLCGLVRSRRRGARPRSGSTGSPRRSPSGGERRPGAAGRAADHERRRPRRGDEPRLPAQRPDPPRRRRGRRRPRRLATGPHVGDARRRRAALLDRRLGLPGDRRPGVLQLPGPGGHGVDAVAGPAGDRRVAAGGLAAAVRRSTACASRWSRSSSRRSASAC